MNKNLKQFLRVFNKYTRKGMKDITREGSEEACR